MRLTIQSFCRSATVILLPDTFTETVPNGIVCHEEVITPNLITNTVAAQDDMVLTCENSPLNQEVIVDVTFARIGDIAGVCPTFAAGDSGCSVDVTSAFSGCIGLSTCTVPAASVPTSPAVCAGGNTSAGVHRLGVLLTCGDLTTTTPAPTAPECIITSSCLEVPPNTTQTLECEFGGSITDIRFASFGNPSGTCTAYQDGSCVGSAGNQSVLEAVRAVCVGQPSCNLSSVEGELPLGLISCGLINASSLFVEAICTANPEVCPTESPTTTPTLSPTIAPSQSPTQTPTISPTASPSASPTESPSTAPTNSPTLSPTTPGPTASPTLSPTNSPSQTPTESPTQGPTESPAQTPTESPTLTPTRSPTVAPTQSPTESPTDSPTTESPTVSPTQTPSASPTATPTVSPTLTPTASPSGSPTGAPSGAPTATPTRSPAGVLVIIVPPTTTARDYTYIILTIVLFLLLLFFLYLIWLLWPSAVSYDLHSEVEEQLFTDRVVTNPNYNQKEFSGPAPPTNASVGMVLDNPFYQGYLDDIVYPESPPHQAPPRGIVWRGIGLNDETSTEATSEFTSTATSSSYTDETTSSSYTDDGRYEAGRYAPHPQYHMPHGARHDQRRRY